MIVDFHTHVLPDEFRRERARILRADATFAALFSDPGARIAPYAELIASMDDAGIDVSVVLGYGWTDQGADSRVLLCQPGVGQGGRCRDRAVRRRGRKGNR